MAEQFFEDAEFGAVEREHRDRELVPAALLLHVERGEDETPDEPDEYYDSSLTGCAAVLLDGSELGLVTEVLHLPSQDMLVVRLADERDVLIPFVSEIVPEVDIVARRVVVDPPVGLLDPPDA